MNTGNTKPSATRLALLTRLGLVPPADAVTKRAREHMRREAELASKRRTRIKNSA